MNRPHVITLKNYLQGISSLQIKTLLAGLLSTALYLYLALSSQHYGQATFNQMFWICICCTFICFLIWHQHHSNKIQISITYLLAFAIVFRAIGISAFPILEDDMYRYLWDARMTMETGSPYNIAPSAFFDNTNLSDRFDHILNLINYPDIATVYGPVSQLFFALGYLIAPGEIWPLQLLLSVADITIILILLRLSQPNNVLLYAWCPLIIKEFAFTAHPDVLGALFIMMALLMIKKRHIKIAGFLLAFAAGVKVFALLIIPFFLRLHFRAWFVFLATACIIALPFGIIDAWVPQGLKAMNDNWLFNAPIYELFSHWTSIKTIKIVLLIALAFGTGAYLLTVLINRQPIEHIRGDLLYGALLLATPVLNPWYVVWLLPFAALRPSLWAWTASTTLLLSYATGLNLDNNTLEAYQLPNWAIIIEFSLIIVAFYVGRRLKLRLTTTRV